MRSISFVALAVALAASAPIDGAELGTATSISPPNIVVILVDDMGYSDVGCYGGEIQTPNVDSLASNGMRFSQFYNCARCCPTRASLLTGAYAQRVGMGEFGRTMDLDVPTLPERLKETGYQTALFGKWHLSELPTSPSGGERIDWLDHRLELATPFAKLESLPTRRGFDRFYGIVWGVVDHFDPFSLSDGERPVKVVPDDYYLTDAISERSAAFVRDAATTNRPFFMYVAYTAPHWPLQAPADEIAKYRGKYADGWNELRRQRFRRQTQMGLFDASTPLGEVNTRGSSWQRLSDERRAFLAAKMEVHAAMIDRVDQGIGRIIASLRETGNLDNTIIFFLSDNGASPEIPGPPGYDRNRGTRDGRLALRDDELQLAANRSKLGSQESYTGIGPAWASATNTPLRYWKMESYEGGCRTPLIVHWPAALTPTAGSISREVGHVIDIAPTCLDLAGISSGEFKMDGISFAQVLRGQPRDTERTLYFEHGQGCGVRRGQWKASKLGGRDWQLFDIDVDPGETNDLSSEKPDMLSSLVREFDDWRREVNQERRRSE